MELKPLTPDNKNLNRSVKINKNNNMEYESFFLTPGFLLLLFLKILIFCYWFFESPLSTSEFTDELKRMNVNSQTFYVDVASFGDGKSRESDSRIAILYPLYWILINVSGKIYAVSKDNIADLGGTKKCSGDGETIIKLSSTSRRHKSYKAKCLPFSIAELLRRIKISSGEEDNFVETVRLDFSKWLHRAVFKSVYDFANFLILEGYFIRKETN